MTGRENPSRATAGAADQRGAGSRDLAEGTPALPEMARPWVLDVGDGRSLAISPCYEHEGRCRVWVTRDGIDDGEPLAGCVDALDLPDVTNAMWRACGLEPPVMLGRHELPADGSSVEVGGFRLWLGGAHVQYQADRTGELAPHMARRLAAVIVALADSVRADEPTADEVDELTRVIVEGDPEARFGQARVLARKLLLARYRREEAGRG